LSDAVPDASDELEQNFSGPDNLTQLSKAKNNLKVLL
jgi:hypothetical protein